MKSLVFIESPLQLLNALEAIHAFKIYNDCTVISVNEITKLSPHMSRLYSA